MESGNYTHKWIHNKGNRADPVDAAQVDSTLQHNPHLGGTSVQNSEDLNYGVMAAHTKYDNRSGVIMSGPTPPGPDPELKKKGYWVQGRTTASMLNRAQFFAPEHFAGVVEGVRDDNPRQVRKSYAAIRDQHPAGDLREHAVRLGLVEENYTPKPPKAGPLKPVSRALENGKFSLAHFDKEQ